MHNQTTRGHLLALFTILIWGTTYISTKVLLNDFLPIEILFFRIALGIVVLCIIYPHRMGKTNLRQELTFFAAGACGICFYFLLENIALTYTLASNVGVIISTAPFFTAILTHIFQRQDEKLHVNFFAGFVLAMVGICMISFTGSSVTVNPLGDFLALLAAFVWACYSVLTRKISGFGFNTVATTRKIFGYGIIWMLPALFFFHFRLGLSRFQNPVYLANIIFLGVLASAICFVTWNYAVKVLGAVKTSVYIYATPVVTVATSMLVLKEKLTVMAGFGILLTLAGLLLSEYRGSKRRDHSLSS